MSVRSNNRLLFRLYLVGMVQLLLVASAAVLIGFVVERLPSRWDPPALSARLAPFADKPAELEKMLTTLKEQDDLSISIYDANGRLVASNVKPALGLPPWMRGPAKSGMPSSAPGGFGGPRPFDWPDHGPPPPPFERPPMGPHPPGGPPMPPNPLGRPPMPPPWSHVPPPPPPPDAYEPFEVGGEEGALVAHLDRRRPSPVPALLTLVSGFLVVGIGALLTARFIARPLERLARTARALGKGELGARADLRRSDELGEVGVAFDEMAERIQTLLLTEKELLANVAHELRTPLARIRVALEIASEGDAATARASLGEITVDLAELETLVDDILTATRFDLEKGQAPGVALSLRPELVSPESIVREASARHRSRHPERPLEALTEDGLPSVRVDAALFRRAIDNLLDNAHKYSPDPSSPILLRAVKRKDDVAFEVIDRGMGVAAEDLSRLFAPFFRSERSRSRGTGGVGLGLTLVKRIVEAHGGAVEVASNAGPGTTFRLVMSPGH